MLSGWDISRILSSSRVLAAVSGLAIAFALLVDLPRRSPASAEALGTLLVVHLWVAIVSVVKRSSHVDYSSVSGRKLLLIFVPMLISYAFLYTSMNAASRGEDFQGATEPEDSESDAGRRRGRSLRTLKAMGDFTYFSMVSKG